MSLVCQKCRRLVRDSNINAKIGTYFCKKCQKTYKLPQSFYKNDELDIPKIPTNSKLNVLKLEDEVNIQFPRFILTLAFKTHVFLLIITSTLVSLLLLPEFPYVKPIQVFIASLLIFFLILVNAAAKTSILIKGNEIKFSKKILFFKLNQSVKLSDVIRIDEIEVEMNKGRGKEIVSRFIEIEFRNIDNWEFGHNLRKIDRDYVIAELKLYHFYNSVHFK